MNTRPMTAKGLVGDRIVSLGYLDSPSFPLRLRFSTNTTLQVKYVEQRRTDQNFRFESVVIRLPVVMDLWSNLVIVEFLDPLHYII